MSMDEPATVRFQQALPYAFLPVSNKLAALHSIRTRTSLPSSCSHCGSDLTSIVTRSKRNANKQRLISTTCSSCGAVSETPIGAGNATSFPRWTKKQNMKEKAQVSEVVQLPTGKQQGLQGSTTSSPAFNLPIPKPFSGSLALSTPNTSPTSAIKMSTQSNLSKGSNQKKSGLQEMLKRNRDKEKRSKAEATKQSGLSAFLSTL